LLSEKGNLIQENSKWHLSTDAIEIPTKIRDIILRRAGILKLDHRKMLEVASVMGGKVDPELLGTVLG